MFEELNERRRAIENNILKSFGIDTDENYTEKAEDIDIEKGKWQVGMTKDYQGVTYVVSGFNAKGIPLWRKQKDGDGSKQQHQPSSGKKWEAVFDEMKKVDGNFKEEMYDELAELAQEHGIDYDKEGKNALKKLPIEEVTKIVNDYKNGKVQASKGQQKQQNQSKKLSEMKEGDTVALIMERYNPQLGDYITIKKVKIDRVTNKSFEVDGKLFNKKSGIRRDKSSTSYGSADYSIMTPEDLKKEDIKDGKWGSVRISGGNPFEDETKEK